MSSEITVLLLEAETLPSALEEHLAKRDVFVEHASGGDVTQMLPMVGPDLVVQSGNLDPLPTIAALKNETNPPPLVIIAERGRLRELRENQHPLIQGLIPADLPVAAIAHRLSTMARRSAEGVPLEGTKPAPKAAPSKVERGSLAPLPLAPLQQVKIVDPEEAQRREEEQAAREAAALREAEAAERAVEAARQKAKIAAEEKTKAAAEEKTKAAAEEKTKAAAEQRRREMELKAEQRKAEIEERRREQAARLEERKREQEKKREERLREQERRAKERASLRVEAQKTSERPKPPENTPSEVKALDDLFSSSTPEPATIRSSHPPELARLVERTATEDLEQTTQAVDISAFAPELDKRAKSQPDPPPEQPLAQAQGPATPPQRPAAPPQRPSAPPQRPSAPPQRPSAPPQRPSAPPQRPSASRAEEPAAGRPSPADFSAVKKTEDLSVIMPLPVDLRLDLAPKAALKPIRLALLDTDLLRADAVAAELRERGMKIHPVTPDPGRTRWPLLRRFAPQGLLVDEKSMPRGAAEWVETFRGDPFLRHVPVVLVRFSRVFDEATGKVVLDPMLPMIEHLGREEFALLEKLGPGRRVDLWLSQVAPYRLVEMLTKEDRNTRLDCKSDTERMVWHLGPGYAGRGKLADLKIDAPKQRLSPAEALAWLLGHEDCQISVFEHAEPLAHASESVDAEELIREMTETLAAPERHESVRPGSLSQAQRLPSAPELSAQSAAALLPNHNVPAPPPGLTAFESGALSEGTPSLEEPLPHSEGAQSTENQKTAVTARLSSAAAALKQAYATYERAARARLSPLEAKVPEPVLRHAPWALPLILALILLLLVLATGEEAPAPARASVTHQKLENAAPKSSATPAEPAGADPAKDKGDEFDSGSGNLWLVDGGNTFPTCEERLGASAPKGKDPIRSSGYWKNARRLLMLGNSDEAIENLCLAGLLDPGGPASEGLAEYYLGQRALAQAERWIKESLKADPERRKSKELLGDIENQKGNTEEAKKLLLATLNLSSEETRKLEVTARKFQKDARLARKGGDLPRAERELRRAALLAPTDAEIAIELGDTLLRREASVAAARWAAQALKLDPNNSNAMLLAARVAETLGKKDKAREYYEMVPLGDPNHDEAQRRRGRL
jgi:hypothetical protein